MIVLMTEMKLLTCYMDEIPHKRVLLLGKIIDFLLHYGVYIPNILVLV